MPGGTYARGDASMRMYSIWKQAKAYVLATLGEVTTDDLNAWGITDETIE